MRIGKLILNSLCAVALTLGTGAYGATIQVDEQFTHPDGDLVGQTPTPGPGATWVAHSGAGNQPIQVSSNQAVLVHGSGSREDANTGFSSLSSGVVSYSFDFSVDPLSNPFSGSDFEYFASFGLTTSSSVLVGRMDLVAPSSTGDYTIGIATTGGSADATWGTDFAYNEVVRVKVDFDFAAGQASLSVNGGTPILAASGASIAALDDFSLRQSTSSNNETIRVDNLVVTSIPEPASIALMLGCLGVMAIRRR